MKRKYILKKQTDVDSLIKKKNVVRTKSFSLFYKKTDEFLKFSLSIGKKFGKAHQRNKIKRQIRAIINLNKTKINNFLFLIIIRPQKEKLSYKEIENEILYLFKKSKIITED